MHIQVLALVVCVSLLTCGCISPNVGNNTVSPPTLPTTNPNPQSLYEERVVAALEMYERGVDLSLYGDSEVDSRNFSRATDYLTRGQEYLHLARVNFSSATPLSSDPTDHNFSVKMDTAASYYEQSNEYELHAIEEILRPAPNYTLLEELFLETSNYSDLAESMREEAEREYYRDLPPI
jgi:hypothetical protein